MDLYADLPLAKGTKTDAVDTDGNRNTSSVWAKGIPTAFVPGQRQTPPAVATSVSMLPSSLTASRLKSPAASAAKPAGRGFSLAFRPASLARKAPAAFASATVRSTVLDRPLPITETTITTDQTAISGGLGFVAATTWTQVTVQKESTEEAAPAANDAAANVNTHFFQATYRDEYHPSRPNNYEAFCHERAAKKKMEHVKRELEERQRDQERESKREREQFVKDVSEGKAPSIALPTAAGRGRGMTVPAWMKKKIEESASQVATPHVSDTVLVGTAADQFEEATFRGGLGFSSNSTHQEDSRDKSNPMRDEFGRDLSARSDRPSRTPSTRSEQNTREQKDGYHSERRRQSRSRDRGRDSSDASLHASVKPTRPLGGNSEDTSLRSGDHVDHAQTRPGRVILLQNMVGPGEVDEELEVEVKEECTTKYGPVEACVVYEVRGRVRADEAVRIFVQFHRQIHADQALNGLNRRFFGGRRVQATYYDEHRFARRDLTA